jgi:hypothetical protein
MGDRFQAMARTSSGGGGGTNYALREQSFVPDEGQTDFTLDYPPVGAVALFVGPLVGVVGTNYDVTGTTVTWLDTPFALDGGDVVTAIYLSTV